VLRLCLWGFWVVCLCFVSFGFRHRCLLEPLGYVFFVGCVGFLSVLVGCVGEGGGPEFFECCCDAGVWCLGGGVWCGSVVVLFL